MVKPSQMSAGYSHADTITSGRIVDFWNSWRIGRYTGGPDREKLEEIEREVTECLVKGNLALANRLTAVAMLLIGSSDG